MTATYIGRRRNSMKEKQGENREKRRDSANLPYIHLKSGF
jgi:hypothetical protein